MANHATVGETHIHVGDTVSVFYRVIEKEAQAGKTKRAVDQKERERLQPFQGIVIAIKNSQENQAFTVRRIGVHGIGIERIFPVISPWISKVEVKTEASVRRSKLYYLREKVGKEATKLKEKYKPKKPKKVEKASKPAVKAAPKAEKAAPKYVE